MISEKDDAAQKDYERILTYRRVFGTPDGKEVLLDIMEILGLNSSIESEEQAALHNAAVAILSRAGIFRPWNGVEYIDALFTIPYTPPQEGDKE
jgi:hypothetical protein